MNFSLIYRGPLKTQQSADPRHKHFIRRQFELQLSVMWKSVPFVNQIGEMRQRWQNPADASIKPITLIEKLARDNVRGKFRFVPLVNRFFGLACSLKVSILRREEPGENFGGDIDNRFKVLVDALKVPDINDLRAIEPDPDEDPDPFFCLLEDDALLTDFQVKSGRLLLPYDYPMSHKIIVDSANQLYERMRHGESIPDRDAWDREFDLEISRQCERRRSENEIWMVVHVTLLAANPAAEGFHLDFIY